MQETPNIDEALEFAISAIDRNDMQLGSAALEWILQREPANTVALLWMACTVFDENLKRKYYSQIQS